MSPGPHGILVNCIAPGSTLTKGTRQLFSGEGGKFYDAVQLTVDGGWTAGYARDF